MTMTTPGGWGGGGWGGSAWGVGEVDLELATAIAVRENVVRLTFTAVPLYTLLDDTRDAARLDHYAIVPVSGVGVDGEPVRPVTPVLVEPAAVGGAALDVTVDRPFTAYAAVYRVSVIGLVSTEGAYLLPGSSQLFMGMRQGELPVGTGDSMVAGRDISNPQTVRDLLWTAPANPEQALGTYQVGPDGDYVSDRAFSNYRKRCIRRVTTRYQGFAHLRNYGAGANDRVKRQATARERQLMAQLAQEQIMLEPETISCTVAVQAGPEVTRLIVRVLTTLQPEPLEFPIVMPT